MFSPIDPKGIEFHSYGLLTAPRVYNFELFFLREVHLKTQFFSSFKTVLLLSEFNYFQNSKLLIVQ